MSSPAHEAIAAVWKQEAARVTAVLLRMVRDVGLAEELAQDALVSALERWPTEGVPDRPGAWLTTAAKHRAITVLRRAQMTARKHEEIAHDPDVDASAAFTELEASLEAGMDDDVADDVLRLIFVACHPVLPASARVALTLRLVGGLSTAEIARAFLATEPTIAQRIVRAKRTLGDAAVPFELPRGDALSPRLASVLEVVYLIFNEGYAASSGDALTRRPLVAEAIRLGELLARLAPAEPEVLGLLALMELQASRIDARADESGEPILLMEQDRDRWDAAAIARGLAHLEAAATHGQPGPYQLQAELAACHARATIPEDTDWARIVAVYDRLLARAPSPVIALNRAVALSRAEGPTRGLAALDALRDEPSLRRYPFLPAGRADLLAQLGRHDEARAAFERAASLSDNERQRRRLLERAAACGRDTEG